MNNMEQLLGSDKSRRITTDRARLLLRALDDDVYEPLAKAAYEAVNAIIVEDMRGPSWEDLDFEIKTKWLPVARAVVKIYKQLFAPEPKQPKV